MKLLKHNKHPDHTAVDFLQRTISFDASGAPDASQFLAESDALLAAATAISDHVRDDLRVPFDEELLLISVGPNGTALAGAAANALSAGVVAVREGLEPSDALWFSERNYDTEPRRDVGLTSLAMRYNLTHSTASIVVVDVLQSGRTAQRLPRVHLRPWRRQLSHHPSPARARRSHRGRKQVVVLLARAEGDRRVLAQA